MAESSIPLTEQSGSYENLDQMSTQELLIAMNQLDNDVPRIVAGVIPVLARFVEQLAISMREGGRLFYIGAGTSGRLGVLDASECPPTFGVPYGMVIGIIAGGDVALKRAVEFAEDDVNAGWNELLTHHICEKDAVVGISASGGAAYVVGAINKCRENGIRTACVTCNPSGKLAQLVDFPLVAPMGPELVTGSTRLKSGTAQKLILNMISTSVMIKLGRVKGNKMVDMQLSNSKLIDRGTRMVMDELHVEYEEANKLLLKYGSVRGVLTEMGK